MVHVAKRDSDNPARIYTSPTTPFISSTATGWLWSNTIRTAYGTRPTGTHFEQPVDDRSRAATMFAPQGHTMNQPHLQGHYDVPAPMQLGHTTPASHHGHLIQQHIPQQLQPPQPQPAALTSPPPHTFMLRPLLLPPHPPMHTFHNNNNNNINHHHHNNSHHRRISHSPPP